MQLQHYIRIIRKKFWLIALGMLLCTGATAAITFIKAPTYEASATIEVNAPDNDVYGNQTLAVTYALQVTNTNVFQEVARELSGVTVAQLQNTVDASPIDGTQLIAVSADATSPQQATAIANAVAQVFINQSLASDTSHQQAVLDQLSPQLATAKTQMDQAQDHVNLLSQENASNAQIQQAQDTLTDDQSLYESLLTSYTTAQMQKAMITGSLSIEQPATLPGQPSGSSKELAIAIAGVMSLMVMLLVVFLLDWMDVTIKTPEDVAHLAQLDALGSIPWQRNGLEPSPLLSGEENSDAIEQTFAVISTNLQALYKGQRALLVTGLRHGSGTSNTAVRLALALAQSGQRVLLVDANLRKPWLHNAFHVVNTRGLVNSLADSLVIQKQPAQIYGWLSTWTTSVPNLWLWPSGPVTISPLTVLRSLELRKMVNWLLQEPGVTSDSIQQPGPAIDIVIFDAPAVLEEADAMALALLCDSTVLVMNAASERKETLKKAESTLERLGAPVLGVVVNRQKATHRPYLYVRQTEPTDSLVEKQTPKMPSKYPLLVPFSSQAMVSESQAGELQVSSSPPCEPEQEPLYPREGIRNHHASPPLRPTLSRADSVLLREPGKQ